MSIFGNILRKIFPSSHPAATSGGTTAATPGAGSAAAPAPAAAPATQSQAAPTDGGQSAAASAPPTSAPAPAAPPVDVEAILNGMAAKNPQKLNWRTSIVDLMKLLGLDSSLQSRKELAQELGYGGDTSDSASMNVWLHKQVMRKLAENGGQVPAELKD